MGMRSLLPRLSNEFWLVALTVALVVLLFGAVLALSGGLLLLLWNQTFPELFGWHALGFWQAIRIAMMLVLAGLLLGLPLQGSATEK